MNNQHSRTVPEWIGKSPDTSIPPRVQLRIVDSAGGCCEECARQFTAAMRPEIDHVTALVNGGENRESNLRALCEFCHGNKTALDVAEKSKVARIRKKHLGIGKEVRRKMPIGGFAALKFKKMPDGRIVDRKTGAEIRA